MEVNFFKDRFIRTTDVYKSAKTMSEALLNRLNSGSFTRIGETITLNDGTTFNVNDIPRLNIGLLSVASSKENVMDFGSARYFKYTNSTGKSLAIFSSPSGALSRPVSENIDYSGYDRETERYLHFWNNLGTGQAIMSSSKNLPTLGYNDDEIRRYLDEAEISKGFFSVKIGSTNSEFFYSNTTQYPLYSKEDYDMRYYTMTSSDFSYDKSVFRCLEPGTEITIAGDKYKLKDDFTLDIPYGTDIFDIQIPKHTHVSKVTTSIDCRV